MARAIVALVLHALFAAAAAEHSRSGVESTEVSLSQIRDTLRNLRRSIEDEEHDAENFYDLRQKWCDDTLHKLEEDLEATHTSLVHLGTDLKEHEAAVEEAEGTAEQIRADIALVQHTLNQTEMAFEGLPDGPQDAVKNTHRLLTALVQNKKQTLLSLQGELQVVLPTLAQMEARLAETQRRYVDRNESTTIHASFVGQLRTGCSDSAERADRKATARMSETSFIETALQALDQMAPNHHAREQRQESAPDSSPLDAMTGLSEVSFVQTSQETVTSEDDLMSIFRGPSPKSRDASSSLLQQEPAATPRQKSSVGSEIQNLLSTLSVKSDNRDQAEWCSLERAQNHLVQRVAQASLGEVSAEINAHVNLEEHLSEELKGIAAFGNTIKGAAKEGMESAEKERTHLAGSQKDQGLATKILAQATSILKELKHSKRLSSRNEKAYQTMLSALSSAKVAFGSQSETLSDWQKQLATATTEQERLVQESVRLFEHEEANLELVRESHVSRRNECEENQRVYEAQASEASQYSEALKGECDIKVKVTEDQEEKVQQHALQDAEKVLKGEEVKEETTSHSLRGAVRKDEANMSPMERAAAEMGVDSDGEEQS